MFGDVARSCQSDTDMLGGELMVEGEPSAVAPVNRWIVIRLVEQERAQLPVELPPIQESLGHRSVATKEK